MEHHIKELTQRIYCRLLNRFLDLIQKSGLSVKAYKIATSMEITSTNVAVLQESKESEVVNKVALQRDGTSKWNEMYGGTKHALQVFLF